MGNHNELWYDQKEENENAGLGHYPSRTFGIATYQHHLQPETPGMFVNLNRGDMFLINNR